MIEFCLRHWSGKAAFAAAFRRPLFSVLQEVYATMDWAKQGTQVVLSGPVLDEILCMSILLPLAETGDLLHGRIPPAGCSVAMAFKEKSLLLPLPLEDPGTCAHCGNTLDQPTWRTYSCPRKCELRGCTLRCIRAHGDVCVRKWWHVPKFGDRFAGHNFPLSKAAGLKGI